ncbi:MAG: NfeD family protein [Bauldia sp.]|nr:NfeD family protein [Bauldia sp.]
MIADFFDQVGPWGWWVLGLVLMGLEIFLPGTFFLWSGAAAVIVGTVALLVDISWEVQVIAFGVLALVLVFIGRRYFARRRPDEGLTGLNDRAAALVGSIYILHEPIVDGSGRIRVGDSTWRVLGPDTPSGTRVRVVAAEGSVLRVAPEG